MLRWPCFVQGVAVHVCGWGHGQPQRQRGGLYAQMAPVLHRLGLVPHLWSIWELLLRGKRMAVFSPNAAVVSAACAAWRISDPSLIVATAGLSASR